MLRAGDACVIQCHVKDLGIEMVMDLLQAALLHHAGSLQHLLK